MHITRRVTIGSGVMLLALSAMNVDAGIIIGSVTDAVVNVSDTFDLTALGNKDWMLFGSPGGDHKAGGTILSVTNSGWDASWAGSGSPLPTHTAAANFLGAWGPTVTWSDGTTQASGSTNDMGGLSSNAGGWWFYMHLPTAKKERTLNVIFDQRATGSGGICHPYMMLGTSAGASDLGTGKPWTSYSSWWQGTPTFHRYSFTYKATTGTPELYVSLNGQPSDPTHGGIVAAWISEPPPAGTLLLIQ